MSAGGHHIVVTSVETRFLRSAGPRDRLVVETEVAEMKRATSTWLQRLVRDGDVIAAQTIKAAITDVHGKPTRMPRDLANALAPFLIEPE